MTLRYLIWPTQKKRVFRNHQFSKKKSCKFQRLVLGAAGLIDAKSIDLAQPMVVRQCGISAKRALKHQKCIWATSLLQIQGPISKDFWEFRDFEKLSFSLVGQKKMLHFYENLSKVLGYQGWNKILIITLISSHKSPTSNISVVSVYSFS